jgi:hypothetical protein
MKKISTFPFLGIQGIYKKYIITGTYDDVSNLAHKMLFRIKGLAQ